mgnify:CR=1 FL=1
MDFTAISATDLGNLLGISERRVRQLAAEGRIPKPSRGKFDGPACVRAVLEAARADRPESSLDRARARAIDARAKAQELRTAREEGALFPFDDAMDIVEDLTGIFVAAIESVPARFTRDRDKRADLERVVFDVRTDVSKSMARRRDELMKEVGK